MGAYTTRPLTDQEAKDIIECIENGFSDEIIHKPNKQVATILTLQGSLGCRIGDICALKLEDIVWDGNAWRLNMTEQKTGKTRNFIIPKPVKNYIDDWVRSNGITSGNLFSIQKPAVWKQLRAVCHYLGLENVSCHSFRKYISKKVYEESGKDIALTSQFLNHSSPSITYRYLSVSSKQMDETLSKSLTLV